MWSVGQRLGDYELVAPLRSGGMAALFLARRLGAAGFSREVAIRIVHPELAADAQFRAMFVDEARISARIRHPNVVHVEQFGEHEGAHFLVMEYVHGGSLAQLQRKLAAGGRRLAPAFAVRIAMHVADALHAAHETCDERGRVLHIVHRDVSPENVLLAYAGHVKLIDFGIAKAYGRRHQTADGLLKGKYRYMAPEQALQQTVDRRTDIYQLGIVLWEMLTLRRLFDADTDLELLAQVRAPRVTPPSALVPHIAPSLEAAVMAALEPDAKKRPADAQAFSRMLARAVPQALQVDAGALSALLVASLDQERRREKLTFPPELYAQLESQVPTLKEVGDGGARAITAQEQVLRCTLEHAALSESEQGAEQRANEAAASVVTQREVAHRHGERSTVAPGAAPTPERARRRRLVRLASELRTTLTRLTRVARSEKRVLVLLSLLGILFAGGLAAATRTARRVSLALPPPVPVAPVRAAKSPQAQMPADSAALAKTEGALTDGAAGGFADESRDAGVLAAPKAMIAHEPRRRAAEREAVPGRRHERPFAAPVELDGIPLIPEPGF